MADFENVAEQSPPFPVFFKNTLFVKTFKNLKHVASVTLLMHNDLRI